jgi:hypothetical protein
VLEDLENPRFYWNHGLHSPDCLYYTELEDVIHSATCFRSLNIISLTAAATNLTFFFFFFQILLTFLSIVLNTAKFNLIISILLSFFTLQSQFDVINKIVIFLLRDFPPGIMQCITKPSLIMTDLYLLMLPLTD